MTEIFFSTVVRAAPLARGGELVHLGWEDKAVRRRTPIRPSDPHLRDPQSYTRGGRGIVVSDGRIIVAGHHEIEIFDRTLQLQHRLTHPLMVGLHEINLTDAGTLWVAATSIDAALEYDLVSGELVGQYWPRDAPELQARLGVTGGDLDPSVDHRTQFLSSDHTAQPSHLHLNAVNYWRGEVYVLLNRFGVIYNATHASVVVEEPALRGGHNLSISDDGLAFVSATKEKAVRIYELPTGRLTKVIRLTDFDWVKPLLGRHPTKIQRAVTKARGRSGVVADAVFVRGLARDGDRIFVGISPASILCIDWPSGTLVDAYRYSEDVRVCVHGLQVDPVG